MGCLVWAKGCYTLAKSSSEPGSPGSMEQQTSRGGVHSFQSE